MVERWTETCEVIWNQGKEKAMCNYLRRHHIAFQFSMPYMCQSQKLCWVSCSAFAFLASQVLCECRKGLASQLETIIHVQSDGQMKPNTPQYASIVHSTQRLRGINVVSDYMLAAHFCKTLKAKWLKDALYNSYKMLRVNASMLISVLERTKDDEINGSY